MSQETRLNKFLAHSGVTSRRKADELILNGKVKVNGSKITSLGTKIDPHKDKVTVDGNPVALETKGIYLAFNKPRTTMEDPKGRPCVGDYISELGENLFPVGRLDWDSEGLLILTNNGDFAHRVSHPKWNIGKTYLVKLDGKIEDKHLTRLLKGVTIIGGKVKATSVEKIKRGADKYDWVKIVITEGKNRQVRRMFEKVGFDVLKLQRVAIGSYTLGRLKKGEVKSLSNADIEKLTAPIQLLEQTSTPKRKKKQRSKKRLD